MQNLLQPAASGEQLPDLGQRTLGESSLVCPTLGIYRSGIREDKQFTRRIQEECISGGVGKQPHELLIEFVNWSCFVELYILL
ncbi:hypothetical protein EK904_006250 [Melospiza melodia maxima]|nr:hypothetical protein EK904_006250 [Melospiza melodia maxima]